MRRSRNFHGIHCKCFFDQVRRMNYTHFNACFIPEEAFGYHDSSVVGVTVWIALMLPAIILNVCLILLIVLNESIQTVTNLILLWSFIFKVLNAAINFPTFIWSESNDKFLPCKWRVISFLFINATLFGSLCTLTFVSINRYRQSKRQIILTNAKLRKAENIRTFLLYSVSIWCVSGTASIFNYFMYNKLIFSIFVGVSLIVTTVCHLFTRRYVIKRISVISIGRSKESKEHVDTVIKWLIISFVSTWLPTVILGSMGKGETLVMWLTKTMFLSVIIEPIVYIGCNKQVRKLVTSKVRKLDKVLNICRKKDDQNVVQVSEALESTGTVVLHMFGL